MDWLDLLAVQGALKSLLQHHSSKASILRCSAFFIVQLSQPSHMSKKEMNTVWPYVVSTNSQLHTLSGAEFGKRTWWVEEIREGFMDFEELELRS